MKKHIFSILPLLFLSLSVFAAAPAPEDPADGQVTINGLKSKVGITVSVAEGAYNRADLKIVDLNGNDVVFADSYTPQTKSVRGYDLSALPSGQYQVSLKVGDKSVKQDVRIYYNDNVKNYAFINR